MNKKERRQQLMEEADRALFLLESLLRDADDAEVDDYVRMICRAVESLRPRPETPFGYDWGKAAPRHMEWPMVVSGGLTASPGNSEVKRLVEELSQLGVGSESLFPPRPSKPDGASQMARIALNYIEHALLRGRIKLPPFTRDPENLDAWQKAVEVFLKQRLSRRQGGGFREFVEQYDTLGEAMKQVRRRVETMAR